MEPVAGIGAASTTTPNTAASGAASTKANVSGVVDKNSKMGKDEFLKLLITQLRYQDPMQPLEDKEFIAQMAQFNSLEQMQTLNKNLISQQDFTQLTQASSLIGKNVSINHEDASFPGKVLEVRRVDGSVKVMVQKLGADGASNGEPPQPYDLSTIEQVA